jgi:hypothetical protein
LRVFIIKEGKEAGQGVAYLDDGTMVVVDQAKKAMGKTIEVTVTSVLQTTAGKMIFCRWVDAPAQGEDSGRFTRSPERRDVRNGRDYRGDRRESDRRDVGFTPPERAAGASAEAHAVDSVRSSPEPAAAGDPPAGKVD